MGLGRTAFSLWLFVNGFFMVTNKLQDRPIEIFGRMSNLMSNTVDLSMYRRLAETIYTFIGILYIALSVHTFHSGRLGALFALLLSLVSSLTFDNPLFNDIHKREKLVMVFAHLIICIAGITLGCEQCGKAKQKVGPEITKEKRKLKADEEGKVERIVESKKKRQ
eukprot:TRINITY_DN790_c0_g1_i3.p1 TRINITY_DN790_c0_g1~~TRINITY_DN790_c0_g1_i3.p1  ORF type:complete len:194 (-),score=10.92 TRINITY_DN790_c0_g1_i3:631-1125(-)